MSLFERLVIGDVEYPTFLLKLDPNTLVISMVDEEEHDPEDDHRITLINPMIVRTGLNQKKQPVVALDHYIPPKLVETTSFILWQSQIMSVHAPSRMLVDLYIKKLANNGQPVAMQQEQVQPEEPKADGNNVIQFKNFKKSANTPTANNDYLVNIYPGDGPKDPA